MVIFIISCLGRNKTSYYHAFLNSNEFKSLERQDQVLKCASCHAEEYENEMKGPHAAAYQKLVEHREFVNSDKYDCGFYTRRVNNQFEGCVGCHAPLNLYETFLFDSLNNRELFVEKMLLIPHPLPPKRDIALRITSIDCLTCHYDGEKMISLKHQPSPDDSIPSKQTLATLTKNNLTCYPCHFDAVKTINPSIAIKRTGSALCVNCHQEQNASGKPTHYYYWQHDAKGKTNTKLISVMDDFHLSVNVGKNKGEISWTNTTIPHKISPGPEIIMNCEVLDKDSNILGSKKIWINKKREFDKEMYEQHENNNLYGTEGDDVPLDGKPLVYSINIKNASTADMFKISLIHKSQYWFPDSLGVLAAKKIYPIKQLFQ